MVGRMVKRSTPICWHVSFNRHATFFLVALLSSSAHDSFSATIPACAINKGAGHCRYIGPPTGTARRQCEAIGRLASAGFAVFTRRDLFAHTRIITVDLQNEDHPIPVRMGSIGTMRVPELQTEDFAPLFADEKVVNYLGGVNVPSYDSMFVVNVDGRIWTVNAFINEAMQSVWLNNAGDGHVFCVFRPRVLATKVVIAPGTSESDAHFYRNALLTAHAEAKAVPSAVTDHDDDIGLDFPAASSRLTGKAWSIRFAGQKQPQTLTQVEIESGAGPGCGMEGVAWIRDDALTAFWPIWPIYSSDNPQVGLGQELPWSTLCESQVTPIKGPRDQTLLLMTRFFSIPQNDRGLLIDISKGQSKEGRIVAQTIERMTNPLSNGR